MISKNQIKLIRSLHNKKYREEYGLFIVEGIKAVAELLASDFRINSIYRTKEIHRPEADKRKREKQNFKDEIISEKELSAISALTTTQGILAIAELPSQPPVDTINTDQLILLLDEIKDPGNMGTILRIADWFGITNIVASNNSADIYNPKVVQASMGSVFYVTIYYSDLSEFLKEVIVPAKLPVYGAIMDGEDIYKQALGTKGCIIIGNESRGISKELESFITNKISIPSFSKRKVDSLNAAVATAIICSEFKRK